MGDWSPMVLVTSVSQRSLVMANVTEGKNTIVPKAQCGISVSFCWKTWSKHLPADHSWAVVSQQIRSIFKVFALKFPTILVLQKKLSYILSTIKCKLPVLPTPCSQFASRLLKMCRFVNVFPSFLVTWGWAAAFWWPALPRLTRFYPFLLCRDRSLHFHWKPPRHKLFFYFGTYQELLHKSYWGGELELSSDFITWLKKSGCKLKLDI